MTRKTKRDYSSTKQFKQRRKGLLKKANELKTKCGVRVSVIIHDVLDDEQWHYQSEPDAPIVLDSKNATKLGPDDFLSLGEWKLRRSQLASYTPDDRRSSSVEADHESLGSTSTPFDDNLEAHMTNKPGAEQSRTGCSSPIYGNWKDTASDQIDVWDTSSYSFDIDDSGNWTGIQPTEQETEQDWTQDWDISEFFTNVPPSSLIGPHIGENTSNNEGDWDMTIPSLDSSFKKGVKLRKS